MKYLVDANVLSEATRPVPTPSVLDWLHDHESDIAVNPIIVGELQYGIFLLPPGARRKRLERWFSAGLAKLHVLELDADTAAVWARLLAELKRKGRAMPVKDSLIAATARQYDLTVATRNIDDYRFSGVALENPFDG